MRPVWPYLTPALTALYLGNQNASKKFHMQLYGPPPLTFDRIFFMYCNLGSYGLQREMWPIYRAPFCVATRMGNRTIEPLLPVELFEIGGGSYEFISEYIG